MDYVIKATDAKTALAGMAAIGLTSVDAKGVRTIRKGGLTTVADMEMLAFAVEATKDRVAAEVAKGGKNEAPTVERVRIDFLRSEKPDLKTVQEKQDFRRSMTEWVLLDIGTRMIPSGNTYTDPFGNEQPEMVADTGHYMVLRWNGDAPPPPYPDGIEVIWSSASPGLDEKTGMPLPALEYPVGLPRFA
jgi:hypothetical protein